RLGAELRLRVLDLRVDLVGRGGNVPLRRVVLHETLADQVVEDVAAVALRHGLVVLGAGNLAAVDRGDGGAAAVGPPLVDVADGERDDRERRDPGQRVEHAAPNHDHALLDQLTVLTERRLLVLGRILDRQRLVGHIRLSVLGRRFVQRLGLRAAIGYVDRLYGLAAYAIRLGGRHLHCFRYRRRRLRLLRRTNAARRLRLLGILFRHSDPHSLPAPPTRSEEV